MLKSIFTRNAMLSGVFAAGALALTGGVTLATSAEATNLRFAGGSPPNSLGANATDYFAEQVEKYSNGSITVKNYPQSLLSLLESNDGLKDGIADFASILWPYFIKEYPNYNFAVDMASIADLADGDRQQVTLAYISAMFEYVILHCPECQAESKAYNHVFLSGLGTPAYGLNCTKSVTTFEDLQGLRVRAGGAWWSRWLEGMGASPVSLPANETFEGLNQGIIDCTAVSPVDMVQFGFMDVIKNVTVGVPGSSFSLSMASMNRDSWLSVTDDERHAILRAGADLSGDVTMRYFLIGQENLTVKAPEVGIKIETASPELIAKSREWIEQDLETLAASYEERFGVKNTQEKIATMRRLFNEWLPRMEGVNDREALSAALWENVYSKVDLSTYGK